MIQTKYSCADSRKAKIGSILTKAVACTIAIAASIGIYGCDNKTEDGRQINEFLGKAFPDPPVSVTFRDSLLTGYVLQVHNTSSNKHVYYVEVENKAKGQKTSGSFAIPPNETQEIGILEMDWAFEPGEEGCISVDNYKKKLYFELEQSGGYRYSYRL